MPGQWTDRMEIKSQTSSRVYVVAQQVVQGEATGYWSCSCAGCKRWGYCKHLTNMGLRPIPRRAIGPTPIRSPEQRARSRAAFSDGAYNHYDTTYGYGSPDEWIAAAAGHAQGRGRFRRARSFTISDDMALLHLTEMPGDVRDLVKAMRRRAQVLHPDHGGDEEDMKAMLLAYERLLAHYPKAA